MVRTSYYACCLVLWWSVRTRYALALEQTPESKGPPAQCYNDLRQPQRCIPEFVNAAFGLQMEATNTCGDVAPTKYCMQTSGTTDERICDVCQRGQFASYYLTDLHHESENQTWWQSDTMYEDIQYPTIVNLDLHLGKAYDITYIRLVFYSPRPESFVIYKRVSEDAGWVPYQYYSQTCRATYGLPESRAADLSHETRPLCTSEYSDISPLKGGNVLFSTLEGRPSAYSFDSSAELQDWVTATDIRISLNRLNTFGDEIFKDEQVLRSYWYAVADVAVGARCKCNGHASRCDLQRDSGQRACRCEHNTAGRDCERCLDFYNDVPWGRASQTNVHECKPCNCNGYSSRCFFDMELYERTGHGGHCVDCAEDRAGPNCEQCRENYYQRAEGVCVPCECDPTGSRQLQCNSEGRCQCKPGVAGARCDRCAPNHYDLSPLGCRPCACAVAGSRDNVPVCDERTGLCFCKDNVEGKQCGGCKPGFFNLDPANEFGCTPCFCYGHSSECDSAPHYTQVTLESQFVRSNERWSAEDEQRRPTALHYNTHAQNIDVSSKSGETVYFVAPERFLGDQRASYNHDLAFNLRLAEPNGYPSQRDVVLEGAGKHIAINLLSQHNPAPGNMSTRYVFRLHEAPAYRWSPTLSTLDFMSILSNLTAIKIRGTYNRNGAGTIDNFGLQTAQRGVAGSAALWVEQCSCTEGYVGQFCESCAPGFRHSPPNGGPFTMCIPCDCNHHASLCDSDTGQCICKHNTAGDNCELCAKGFYGNAISGTERDCAPCPCPQGSACLQMQDGAVVCTECPHGYAGYKCDACADGFAGEPAAGAACEPCVCSGNVDPNAVGNCDTRTGECLKCIYNTAGARCDRCLGGYFGDALSARKGDCRPCECDALGTLESEEGPPQCHQLTGDCACKPHVFGKSCDACEPGYYNLQSGVGCEPCNCNPDGSHNSTCHPLTGQCHCKPGVDGKQCDVCKAYHYGFSSGGCQDCNCDESGSTNFQCDPSGQCSCQPNVEGTRCDRCMENKRRRGDGSGCYDCPHCYTLVQHAASQHRQQLQQLDQMLSNISKEPTVVESGDFESELGRVRAELRELAAEAEGAAGEPLAQRLGLLGDTLARIREAVSRVEAASVGAERSLRLSEEDLREAKRDSERARRALGDTMDMVEGEGLAALTRAQNRSEQFGQQSTQMSLIAHESRLQADKLETSSKRATELAQTAYNNSRAANALAWQAAQSQNRITDETGLVARELSAAAGALQNARELAAQALNSSKLVYDKALDAYVSVNSTQLPHIDAKGLQSNATQLINKAKELQQMIDELREKHEQVLSALEEQLKRGLELHSNALEREADVTEMMSQLDDVRERCAGLVGETAADLRDARIMHNTLKNFSSEMQESRRAAEAESASVGEARESLTRVRERADRLHLDLAAANATAARARDRARDAHTLHAARARQTATELRGKASATHTQAHKLRNEAEKLSGRVSETARRIDGLNQTAQENAQYTNDAKIKVAQARTDAGEADKLVTQARKDLQHITDELSNLQPLNDTELDNLETNLKRAEEELGLADLSSRVRVLHQAKTAHLSSLAKVESWADWLQSQVDNVRSVRDALPIGCFKNTNLEPN